MELLKVNKWLTLCALLVLTLLFMDTANASTGAQATIHSSAKLTYNGGSAYASATVKVKLVAAAVDISVNTTTATVEAGQNVQFTYTFAANANGKDTYTLATENLQNDGVDTPTISFSGGNSVELGASIMSTPMDTNNVLKIPAATQDMFDDNDIVRVSDGNGTYPGTYRVISRTAGSVATTDTNGNTIPESPALITLQTVTGSDLANVPAGVQIGEVKEVVVTVTTGTVNGGAANPEHTINFSVTSSTDANAKSTSSDAGNNEIVISVTVPSTLVFTKEVKLSSATDSTYVSFMEASPGDALTYRITVSNNSAAIVTGAKVMDVIPNFTIYIADSIKLNDAAYTGDLPWSVNTMPVKSASAVNGGDILANETAVVTYQVTIN